MLGYPDLPFIHTIFAVPPNSTITDVQCTHSSLQVLSNSCVIYPIQNNIMDETDSIFINPDSTIYNMSTAYPTEILQGYNQGQLREYQLVGVEFCPFRYIPSSGSLSLANNMLITISYSTSTSSSNNHKIRDYDEIDQFYWDLIFDNVQNPSDMASQSYYQETYNLIHNTTETSLDNNYFGFAPTSMPSTAGSRVSMVIITNNFDVENNYLGNLTGKFNQYADWKTAEGIPTKVVNLSDITSNYFGFDLQEQIRNFIQDAHYKWGTEYVILGGDYSILPTRNSTTYLSNDFDAKLNTYTDLYYSDIWDASGYNNWNGYPDYVFGNSEDSDEWLIPDIIIGRIPVESETEFDNYYQKAQTYSKVSGSTSSFYYQSKMLLYAGIIVSGSSNIITDYNEILGNTSLYNKDVDKGYYEYSPDLEDECYDVYHLCTNYTETASECASNITNQLLTNELSNSGYGLFIHSDHSSPNYLGVSEKTIGGQEITIDDLSTLNFNNNYSVAFSMGCKTSGFLADDCIGEEWLLQQNSGGPAFIGSIPSAYSSDTELQKTFIKQLRNNNITQVGKCFSSTILLAPGLRRQASYILFGDPTINIPTETVSNLTVSHPSSIDIGENSFTVSVSGLSSEKDAVICINKDGEVYDYKTVSNTSNSAQFDIYVNGTGTIDVVVSSANFMQYQGQISVSQCSNPEIAISNVQPIVLLENETSQTVEFAIDNNGIGSASSVIVLLEAENGYGSIITNISPSSIQIGDLSGGASYSSVTFNVSIADDQIDHSDAKFKVTVNSRDGLSQDPISRTVPLSIPIVSPDITINQITVDTEDSYNIINNGQLSKIGFTITNKGHKDLTNCIVVVEPNQNTPQVTFTSSSISIPSINKCSTVTTAEGIHFTITDALFTSNVTDNLSLYLSILSSDGSTIYEDQIDLIRPSAPDNIYYYTHDKHIGLWWNFDNGTYPLDYSYNVYSNSVGQQKLTELPIQYASYMDIETCNDFIHKNFMVSSISPYGVEGDLIGVKASSIFQPNSNFPLTFDKTVFGAYTSGSPKLYDLNNNGKQEIIFTLNNLSNKSGIAIVDYNGNLLASQTYTAKSSSVPAICDMNNDGSSEIIFSVGKKVKILTAESSNGNFSLSNYNMPEIELDYDIASCVTLLSTSSEVLIAVAPTTTDNLDNFFYVYDNQGILKYTGETGTWNIKQDNPTLTAIDFDNDGSYLELLHPTSAPERVVHSNLESGSFVGPITSNVKPNTCIAADLNGDNVSEFLFNTMEQYNNEDQIGITHVYNSDYTTYPNWDLNTHQYYEVWTYDHYVPNYRFIINKLSVGAFDDETGLKVIVPDGTNSTSHHGTEFKIPDLRIWNKDASEFTSFQVSQKSINPFWTNSINYWDKEPLIANIDDDPENEIIIAQRKDKDLTLNDLNSIWAFNIDGSVVDGFPLKVPKPIAGSPVIGDVYGDGELELVALSGYEVYMWDIGGDANSIEWGSFRHDNYNTGNYDSVEPCFTDNNTITVSSTTTWADSRNVYSDIRVESGSTLTVEGNLGMAASTRIIVERGAKLIVDGAVIKGICNDPWNGIQVWGNSNKNQSAVAGNGYPEQGQVELYNATIMDAEKAVFAGYELPAPPDGGQSASDFNGGIIIADNTTFKNSCTALEFNTYSYDSYSGCTECSFIFDNGCSIDGVEFKDFVHLTGYSELEIFGCDFVNYSTDIKGAEELRNGIYCMDSGLDIDGTCLGQYTANGCLDIKPTTFTNLYYAIFASNVTSMRTLSVHHADFTDNITGIYMNNINYPEIVLNTFDVPEDWGDENKTGLYFDYCTGYVVQQNEFLSGETTTKQHGIVVNESGVNENLIYNNSFENINEAIKTQGINHGIFEKEDIGLEIKCNEFFECIQDIRVHAEVEGSLTPDDYGIKPIQGFNGLDVKDPAGNRFSQIENNTTTFEDFNNDGIAITYHHHDAVDETHLIPQDYYRITPNRVLNNTFTSSDAACPNKYDPYQLGNQGGSSSTESLKSAFDSGTTSAQSLTYTLEQTIDGGDTPEMVYDVETSTPPESIIVRDELLAETPYLSDTVVSSAIEKEDVLNNTMIYEVMTSNPKSARSQELMEKLDERQTPMPDYLKEGIVNASAIITERDSLEGLLAMHNRKRQEAFNRIITKYNSLSGDPVYTDSISDMLHNYRIAEQFQEVLLKFDMEDNSYSTVYDNIPGQFILTPIETAEYESLGDFIDLIEIYNMDQQVISPDSSFVSEMEYFIDNNSGWTKQRAINILRRNDLSTYIEPYQYDNLQKSKEQVDEWSTTIKSSSSLEFYPNPASSYLTIDYLSNERVNDRYVIISTMDGTVIQKVELSTAPSSTIINLRDYSPGVYLITLYENGVQKESHKVTHL